MLPVTYEKSGAIKKQGAVRVAVRVHSGNCCAGDQDTESQLRVGTRGGVRAGTLHFTHLYNRSLSSYIQDMNKSEMFHPRSIRPLSKMRTGDSLPGILRL